MTGLESIINETAAEMSCIEDIIKGPVLTAKGDEALRYVKEFYDLEMGDYVISWHRGGQHSLLRIVGFEEFTDAFDEGDHGYTARLIVIPFLLSGKAGMPRTMLFRQDRDTPNGIIPCNMYEGVVQRIEKRDGRLIVPEKSALVQNRLNKLNEKYREDDELEEKWRDERRQFAEMERQIKINRMKGVFEFYKQ